jgi:peroxiredoxin
MNRLSILCVLLTALGGSLLAGSLAIDSSMPDFSLKSVAGEDVASASLAGDVTLVTFVATQCPISNDYNKRMVALYNDYNGKGVKFIFVNSNVKELAAEVKQHAAENGFPFQVHKDPGNVVADQFGAQVTPESFLFKAGKLVYHGRIDNSQTGTVTDHSLRTALDAVLSGKTPADQETKAFGCTIKRVKAS